MTKMYRSLTRTALVMMIALMGVPAASVAQTPGDAAPSIQRLNDLENTVRDLTGQIEKLGYENRMLKDKIERLETEVNFRLNQLEGNPNPDKPKADNLDGGVGSGDSADKPAAGDGPKEPGTIGDTPTPKADGRAEDVYNQAMDHLTKSEYEAALRLFRQVVTDYPGTDYAAQAQYWIADIHYVQKDYEKAALAFAEVIKKYPTAGRGPEAMLKLGLSLINIGKKPEGCKTLGAIKQQYPKASEAILSRADREAKKAECGT
jgi:tol-pal system protein YbgF